MTTGNVLARPCATFALLILSLLFACKACAQQTPINADADWCLVLGASRTWPSLASANRDIRDIQRQLASYGAPIGTLPTWADTLTGNVGVGLQRRLPLLDGRIWAGVFFSYAEGPISKAVGLTPSASTGVAPGARFEQVYRFQGNEVFLLADVLTFKRAVFSVGGGIGLNSFSSSTDVALYGPGFATASHTRAVFSDVKPSASVQAGLDILLTKHVAVNLTARYVWGTFEGSSPAATVLYSNGMALPQVQPKNVVVDIGGPSIGIFLKCYL